MSKTALAWAIAYGAGLLLSVVDPFYGLLAYLLDYYANPPHRWWGRPLPDLRWSLLAGGVILAAYLVKGGSLLDRRILRHAQTKWLIGFLGIAILITPMAISVDRSLHYLTDIVKLTVLYFLIVGTVRTRSQFRWFVLVMIVGAFVWGLDAFADPKRRAGRLFGIGGPDSDTDNSTAAHLLTVIPFIGLSFLNGRLWEKALCVIAAPFVLNTIILCNSRGATLAIGAAAVAALAMARGKFRVYVAGLALLGGVLFVSLVDSTFVARQLTLLQYEEDNSAVSRIESWKGALRLMRDHPLGTGGGGFDILSPVYIPEIVEAHGGQERAAHNTYLWVGSDWGVVGLVLFMGFIATTLVDLHRIRRETTDRRAYLESFAIEVALIGFLTAAFFINRPYAEILYWLAALTAVLRNLHDAERETASAIGPTEDLGTQDPLSPGRRCLQSGSARV